MNNVFCAILLISFSILLSLSCSKDGGNNGGGSSLDCSTVANKSFAADVNPIVQASCNQAGCHASGSFNGPGAITNYNEVFTNRGAIRNAIASGRMPQTGTLTTAQRNSILCWIDSGAPNN